jgi:hypothetical protein
MAWISDVCFGVQRGRSEETNEAGGVLLISRINSWLYTEY